MNENPLRDALSRLPLPEPPADLRERCRATIPGPAPRRWTVARRLTLAAVAAGVLGVALLPRTGRQRTPGIAWAEVAASVEAAPVLYSRVRSRAFDATHASSAWSEQEGWWSAKDGVLTRSQSRQEATLTLPDDSHYVRSADSVRCYRLAGIWGVRLGKTSRFDLLTRGQSVGDLKAAGSAMTTWNGVRAIRFDFREEPRRLSWRGENFLPDTEQYGIEKRREVFVEPNRRRILAMRRHVRWLRLPGKPEALVMEATWDYPERIAPSVFDPKRFCAGARVIRMKTP